VGNYALIRRIGSGGMGEVWLGRHVVSGSLGAVKRLTPQHARREALTRFFTREGRAIARLSHPHVVPLFEYGDDYLVTGFVAGSNLARRMQTPVDPTSALRMTRQIAAALAHAHERGVVHRDVKPANILLDEAGTAYLSDFGVASLGDEHAHEHAGTPRYMAPEQLRRERVGPAADQYALGLTLLGMLAGMHQVDGRDAALAALPAELPLELRAAVERATDPVPEQRFPDCAAFADALASLDLSLHAAPARLGELRRAAAPYGWLAGAHHREALGADIERADYRLGDLVARGLLDATRAAAFLSDSGLGEVGFSLWGASARLGSLTDAQALARSAEVVVLLHGLSASREVWRHMAPVLCRGNSLTVVLAPDIHGFGESRFAGMPTLEQASLPAIARATQALRRLLRLGGLPTVLVGHSMAGIALLALEDHDYEARVARVALNPILVGHDPALRPRIRRFATATRMLGRVGFLYRWVSRRLSRRETSVRDLAPVEQDAMLRAVLAQPPAVLARIMEAFAAAPLKIGRQQRATIVAGVDDPWLQNEAALLGAAADLGLEPAQIHRLASGGHHPHLESVSHPEWTARNVDQLVRVIESMIVTAHEPTSSHPGQVAATPGDTLTADE